MLQTEFSPDLKAHLSRDASMTIRHIRHSQERRLSDESSPRLAAAGYVVEMAKSLGIPSEQLAGLDEPDGEVAPAEQGVEYRFAEEKHQFGATTVSYSQTFFNVPVWRRGLSVKVDQAPTRIVAMTHNGDENLEGTLPSRQVIDRYRTLFGGARRQPTPDGRGATTVAFLRETLGLPTGPADVPRDNVTLLNGRFVAYKYVPDRRFAGDRSPPEERARASRGLEDAPAPLIALPRVSPGIQPRQTYLVAELSFRYDLPGFGHAVWLALVELETSSTLYLECMTQGVNGLVFKRDPNVSSGDLSVNSAAADVILEDHDADVLLHDLDAPMNGTQRLRGTYVEILEESAPVVAAPTKPANTDFDFKPRTNDFAAVNAYYHQTELFRTIADLGFDILDYFDGTKFPIPVDHRGLGNNIDAHWYPNGIGGTDHMCFALCDVTNIAAPLGRAVDPWVHWHETGGHGTLGDHVGSGLLGFAHSAGDSLAAIQMDPESKLRSLPERFRYAPFRPIVTVERRIDRAVPEWAWGSPVVSVLVDGKPQLVSGDDLSYGSEQILATCHFRVYRSIGGDHSNVGRRKFASRVMTYLILRTIGNLTPVTNPSNTDPDTNTNVPGRGAQLWCEELQDTDLENWTSEGLSGGAYNKVIRWSFEKQGSYGGDPPEVDVYIDDGRGGEYPFKANHWTNKSVWNRHDPDDLPGHQNAVAGVTNHMYVKVKNRGTSDAGEVVVNGFHCLPGAGLTWPVDFTPMSPADGLTVPSIALGNSEEVTVGPFEWVPNENVHGHDCVLMIASTDGDTSNIDNFAGNETLEEWRLVPNDNNVGQRNVTIEPGAGGGEALFAALDGAVFVAANSFRRPADMKIEVKLPSVLARREWKIDLGKDAEAFRLTAGEKRRFVLKPTQGKDFTPQDVRGTRDRAITIELLADGVVVGGMTYELDPALPAPAGGPPGRD